MLRTLGLLALCFATRGVPEEPLPKKLEEPPVYGLLPMRFVGGGPDSVEYLLDLIQLGLEGRGAQFVPAARVAEVLRNHRIRQTDSLSVDAARILGNETEVRYLVAGTLLDYALEPTPRMAIALHLVDARTGHRAHSCLVSLRGVDFKGLLGLGEIDEIDSLTLEVAARLLEDFDEAGWPALPERESLESSLPGDSLGRFMRSDYAPRELERIAVLPFVNRTNRRDAGRLFGEVMGHQWFRTAGVDVVESSELRAALVRQRVRSLDLLDEAVLRRVGDDLGVRYFLLGSVDRFETSTYSRGAFAPELEVSARLLDVVQSRVVASGSIQRRGNDYHYLLGLGNVGDLTSLADRVARELVALMGVKP